MTHGGQWEGAEPRAPGSAVDGPPDAEPVPLPAADVVPGPSWPDGGDLPDGEAAVADGARNAEPKKREASSKRIAADKVQVTAYLPRDVAEAARDAVVATTPYRNGYRGLSELVADAVAEKVERLQRQFNSARPFPPRQVDLRPGRRMS